MHTLAILLFCYLGVGLFIAKITASDELAEESERHATRCLADDLEPWSYRGYNGPNHWAEIYPECHGLRQSPVFIDTGRLQPHASLHKLYFYYGFPMARPIIRNDGHTIQLSPIDNSWGSIYINNAFHRLIEIHFHWGSLNQKGSEHIVDGVQYDMEMHLVHRNPVNNATAVVAVLFQEDDRINSELHHIVNELSKVMYKDTQVQMPYRLDGLNLLPENPAAYYLYEGSLTTPECTEGVVWFVLKSINHVGKAQMAAFRNLFSSQQNMTEDGCKISGNFRPVQPLFRRRVFTST